MVVFCALKRRSSGLFPATAVEELPLYSNEKECENASKTKIALNRGYLLTPAPKNFSNAPKFNAFQKRLIFACYRR
jgi:hypothetical protein